MSEQKPEKPTKATPWWAPVLLATSLGWLLNNLITIITFIATGVVNLSHVGVGPFLLALGLSVVCGVIGVVIGIRLCLAVIFRVIAAFFHQVKLPPATLTPQQQEDIKAQLLNKPASYPPTRWEAIRFRASEIAGSVFAWLLIPKWPSRPR